MTVTMNHGGEGRGDEASGTTGTPQGPPLSFGVTQEELDAGLLETLIPKCFKYAGPNWSRHAQATHGFSRWPLWGVRI